MKRLCQAGETQSTKAVPRAARSCPAAVTPRAQPCGRGSPGHAPPPSLRDGESRGACAVAPAPPSLWELRSGVRVGGGAGPAVLRYSHSDRRAGGSGEAGAAPRGPGGAQRGSQAGGGNGSGAGGEGWGWLLSLRVLLVGLRGVGVTAEGAGLGVGTGGGPTAALLSLQAAGGGGSPCRRESALRGGEGDLSFPALPGRDVLWPRLAEGKFRGSCFSKEFGGCLRNRRLFQALCRGEKQQHNKELQPPVNFFRF